MSGSGQRIGPHAFSLAARLSSFRNAISGIGLMLRTQHNAWIHAAATAGVFAAAYGFGVSRAEWAWLVLAVVAVWTAEAMNTALEILADAAVAEYHPLVKKAKDVAAGAVLITALGAAVVGIVVFAPRLLALGATH